MAGKPSGSMMVGEPDKGLSLSTRIMSPLQEIVVCPAFDGRPAASCFSRLQ